MSCVCNLNIRWDIGKEKGGLAMAEMNNKAMYKLSYGLFVCTAVRGDKKNGCIINLY